MTRTSIDACIKLFIVVLVAVFAYVFWHVLKMMGAV